MNRLHLTQPAARWALLGLLVLALALALGGLSSGERYGVAPPVASVRLQEATPVASYTVQPGDSLSRIANRHGITLEALVAANNITSTVIHPGQVLIIPGVAPTPAPPGLATPAAPGAPAEGIYNRIRGPFAFVERVKAALDWMKSVDPEAFARADGYITTITQSRLLNIATARPMPGGCAVQALARRDMSTQMIAALLYHEASHCYQFATEGILFPKAAELYAYGEQIAFMERHGFPAEEIDYYRRIVEYYQAQPDDARRIPPPDL